MAANATRRTFGQLLQQGWTEIPEIMASSGLAITGLVLGTYACYEYVKNDGDNRRYKKVYVIMRPDDPRVSKIKRE
ncbi:jg5765 [Pararge aegeria aegeria]|uniref:Jg5765 protein n=2 Tax=Pararge aegeria TaxID=116150 RepID=A0A8S4SFU3_9NEOP|nr:jg5765 [Pararge aegeria aegeria]